MVGTLEREEYNNDQVFELLALMKTKNKESNKTFTPIEEKE